MELDSTTYSNDTLFGIQHDGERAVLAAWYIFVVVSSLLGDTAILVGSIKYRAFELNKATVAFIQHIAAADLGFTSTYLAFQLISIIAKKQIYGPWICFAIPYFGHYFATAGVLLICLMTVSKLVMMSFPLRSWTGDEAQKICTGMWVLSLYYPIVFLAVDKSDVYFDYRSYSCMYGYTSDVWRYLQSIIFVIIPVLPNVVLVIATVILLVKAQKFVSKSRKSLRWQGILTVLLTAIVFTMAFLPYSIYCILEKSVGVTPTSIKFFFSLYYRISVACMALSALSNFFIYSLTVRSFRAFLRARLHLAFRTRFHLAAFLFSSTNSAERTRTPQQAGISEDSLQIVVERLRRENFNMKEIAARNSAGNTPAGGTPTGGNSTRNTSVGSLGDIPEITAGNVGDNWTRGNSTKNTPLGSLGDIPEIPAGNVGDVANGNVREMSSRDVSVGDVFDEDAGDSPFGDASAGDVVDEDIGNVPSRDGSIDDVFDEEPEDIPNPGTSVGHIPAGSVRAGDAPTSVWNVSDGGFEEEYSVNY